MDDFIIMWEWFAFAVRWLHVITAIAWIGSSFYFIALDLGLKKSPNLPAGAYGEEWQVHGGGFYHIQKYSKHHLVRLGLRYPVMVGYIHM
mgnify:CR=1 FL=1